MLARYEIKYYNSLTFFYDLTCIDEAKKFSSGVHGRRPKE